MTWQKRFYGKIFVKATFFLYRRVDLTKYFFTSDSHDHDAWWYVNLWQKLREINVFTTMLWFHENNNFNSFNTISITLLYTAVVMKYYSLSNTRTLSNNCTLGCRFGRLLHKNVHKKLPIFCQFGWQNK